MGKAAQQPRQAGQPLGGDGVALVGHGAGALLAGAERLLDLGDLGVLEVADLGREALDGAAGDGDGRQERGVAVALHDLGADVVGVQAQLRHHVPLHVRAEQRVGADRPGELAGGEVVRGLAQALAIAVELERPGGQLQAEGDRLGVDGVGAAHHHRVGLLPGTRDERVDGGVQLVEQQLPGGAALQRERGVDHVAAGEAEVDPAAVLADRLGDLADEGDHVVIGGLLQLGDARHVHAGVLLHGLRRLRGDRAARRQGVEHRDLDAQHLLEARLVRPQRAHLRQRVARDHAAAPASDAARPMSRRIWRPENAIRSAAS